MRLTMLVGLLGALFWASCGNDPGAAASPAPQAQSQEAAIRAPAGDPAALPKIPAEAGAIRSALRERFGEAVARNIRVEVDTQGGGIRVRLIGEVPNEEIRQAVMKELDVRVPDMKTADFTLDVAGPIRRLFGFDGAISNNLPTVFSPDLALVVSGQGHIYELATGRRLNRIAYPDTRIVSLAISPDGRTLATGFSAGGIVLSELPLGRNHRTLAPFDQANLSQRIEALQFTPDGKSLVSISNQYGEVIVWDLASGRGRTIGSHSPRDGGRYSGYRHALAVSPDGKLIASATSSDTAITIWDIAARAKKTSLNAQPVLAEAIAWSHDGKTLAVGRGTGDRRGVVLFEVDTGKASVLVNEPDKLIHALAFSPDDRTLAVTCRDEGVELWDVAAKKLWLTLGAEKVGTGNPVAFSPDGTVLATGCEGLSPSGFRLWDVSKRPGAAAATARMPPEAKVPTRQDDLFVAGVEQAIRRTFDRSNIETLQVELQPDGAIRLSGRVSGEEVKRVAQRTAEVYRPPEDVGRPNLTPVINELVVTGVYGQRGR